MASGRDGKFAKVAVKVAVAGAIGFGAVATGLLVSRRGRNLVREAWEGRRRTRIEDRVLDALWADRVLGRRDIDAQEVEQGRVVISGQVRSGEERGRAMALAELVKGVASVEDRLEIVPQQEREGRRRSRRKEPAEAD
jgi:hypothetical protein